MIVFGMVEYWPRKEILFFKGLPMENLPPIVQLMALNYGSLMFKEV